MMAKLGITFGKLQAVDLNECKIKIKPIATIAYDKLTRVHFDHEKNRYGFDGDGRSTHDFTDEHNVIAEIDLDLSINAEDFYSFGSQEFLNLINDVEQLPKMLDKLLGDDVCCIDIENNLIYITKLDSGKLRVVDSKKLDESGWQYVSDSIVEY